MRPHPVRIAATVVGFTLTVYGAASLTGGWLGTPPWWERELTSAESFELSMNGLIFADEGVRPREQREPVSIGFGVVGLALVACSAWPRRARDRE